MQVGVQVPLGQAVVPFAFVHIVPHAPQCVTVVVLVSQPLTGSASQSAKPELQVGMHKPVPQLAVPFAFVHIVMQLPHVSSSDEMFASQPLVGVPSQSA